MLLVHTALQTFYAHTIAAHEHLLIDQFLKHAKCPWFVQPALVATDGGHAAYILKR